MTDTGLPQDLPTGVLINGEWVGRRRRPRPSR